MSDSSQRSRRSSLAILTNIVAPYRIAVYRELAQRFDVTVLYSGAESNRPEWAGVEVDQDTVRYKRSWGVVIDRKAQKDGNAFDHRFLHLTPGYLWDLFRVRPDAIITTELGPRTILALLYGAVRRVPVWVWWGGTMHTEASRTSRRVARRVLIRFVQRWLSYGSTSTEYLRSLGVAENRILQIQNCVDERLYQGTVEPRFESCFRPVVLFVGRFVPLKGADLLLKAIHDLQSEGIRFTTLLVGSGFEENKLRALAQTLRLRDVHFHKGVPANQMPSVYRSADVLVFPTLGDVWGLVINEAMWSGIPVIASCYAGASVELLPPEQIFDPADPESFLAVLRSAISHGLPRPDITRLKPSAAVARMISEDIERVLA